MRSRTIYGTQYSTAPSLAYTADFLTKAQADNNGDLEQYFIKDDHPAIIPREEWEAVQIELARRENFRQKHSIRTGGSSTDDRFYSRVFCEHCGGKFIRKNWRGNRAAFWKCENAQKKNGHTCDAEIIQAEILRQAVVIAWNSLVEQRDELLECKSPVRMLGQGLCSPPYSLSWRGGVADKSIVQITC